MTKIKAGDFVMHNETFSVYKVLTMLGETFVDNVGKIHETKNYTKITLGGER